jgi:hypothetical protein
MRGGTADTAAGWAYVSGGHGVAISVDYGVPSGDYTVRVVPARGDAATIGTMSVAGGRGSWTGSSATPLVTDSRIALVDAEGSEVCHGTVSSAE